MAAREDSCDSIHQGQFLVRAQDLRSHHLKKLLQSPSVCLLVFHVQEGEASVERRVGQRDANHVQQRHAKLVGLIGAVKKEDSAERLAHID